MIIQEKFISFVQSLRKEGNTQDRNKCNFNICVIAI